VRVKLMRVISVSEARTCSNIHAVHCLSARHAALQSPDMDTLDIVVGCAAVLVTPVASTFGSCSHALFEWPLMSTHSFKLSRAANANDGSAAKPDTHWPSQSIVVVAHPVLA
jgi:hypothetical protein